MHACGHDVHITALVGTARQMVARRANWSGTLVLIAQPAEETISGARAMIEDGLYTRFPKPDYALAFHVAAEMPAGRIEVPRDDRRLERRFGDDPGPRRRHARRLSASRRRSGAGRRQIVVSLQSMVGRDINPLEGAVISVGSIHGGVKSNIIPEQVELQLTVRADTPEVRTRLLDGIDRVARGTALALGVPEDRLPVVTRSRDRDDAADDQRHRRRRAIVRDAIAGGDGRGPADRAAAHRHGRRGFRLFRHARKRRARASISASAARRPSRLATAPGHHSPLFRIEPEPSVTAGVEAMVVAAEALMPALGRAWQVELERRKVLRLPLALRRAQQHVHLRRGDRLGAVELPGMGLDIGDALAEPGDGGGGDRVVLGAAAHDIGR